MANRLGPDAGLTGVFSRGSETRAPLLNFVARLKSLA